MPKPLTDEAVRARIEELEEEERGLRRDESENPDADEGERVASDARRLEAIRLLHWRTVSVWVRSGVSTRLGHLLAEQDENAHRKPLNQLEAAALYRELKQLMTEDAQRRRHGGALGNRSGS